MSATIADLQDDGGSPVAGPIPQLTDLRNSVYIFGRGSGWLRPSSAGRGGWLLAKGRCGEVGEEIAVVASSRALRDMVRIALGARYPVRDINPDDADVAVKALAAVDLVVVGDQDAALPRIRRALGNCPHILVQLDRPGGARPADLVFPFAAEQLRQIVQRRLCESASVQKHVSAPRIPTALQFPLIPHGIASVMQQVAGAPLPVLVTGESGVGKGRIAREIHRLRGAERLVALPAHRLRKFDLRDIPAGTVTLYISALERMAADDRTRLSELLEWIAGADGDQSAVAGAVRLVCSSTLEPDELAATFEDDPALFHRVAVLPVALPPLRARVDDVAALVEFVSAALGGDRTIVWTRAAVDLLKRYAWPGNLAEFQAVLGRSIVFCASDQVDAGDLRFDSRLSPTTHARDAAGQDTALRAVASSPPATTASPADFEMLVQDLAHEFKNPMVTIKTASQALARMLDGPDGSTEMARATGDAVDRMDQALDNLLQFSHFGQPSPTNVRLESVIADCLDMHGDTLRDRKILLDDRVDHGASTRVDRAQLSYALDNLLQAALRAVDDGSSLVLRMPLTRCGLTLEMPRDAGHITGKLARWTDARAGLEASMYFSLAKATIERNGGKVSIRTDEARTAVTLELPGSVEEVEEHEETAHLGR